MSEERVPDPQLGALIDTGSIEDLRTHEELGSVYRAAAAIVISNYNGRIDTPSVDSIPAEHEPLVHQLLQRFDDGRGFIEFPYARGNTVDDLVVSAQGVAKYRMVQRTDPTTHETVTSFTSSQL